MAISDPPLLSAGTADVSPEGIPNKTRPQREVPLACAVKDRMYRRYALDGMRRLQPSSTNLPAAEASGTLKVPLQDVEVVTCGLGTHVEEDTARPPHVDVRSMPVDTPPGCTRGAPL